MLEARIRGLEEELDGERHDMRLAEELFGARMLHIESIGIQHFRDSVDYKDEFTNYGTIAYVKCIDDKLKLVTKRRVEVAVPILTEATTSYKALASSVQTKATASYML